VGVVRLRPTNSLQVQRTIVIPGIEAHMELTDKLVDNVVESDNLADPCYSIVKESFWIMLCEKSMHVVEVGFKDGWNQE
jgi:hypothetical protein